MTNLIKFTPVPFLLSLSCYTLTTFIHQGFVFLMDPFAPEGSLFSFVPSSCETCGQSFHICGNDPALCKKVMAKKTGPVENDGVETGMDDVD